MSEYYSRRNIDFLLKEVLDTDSLLELNRYKKHDINSIMMVLDTAGQLADKEMYPYFREMERDGPKYENGTVKVHPRVKRMLKKFGEGGWIAATADESSGGQQLPVLVSSCAQFIFGAANYSASVYPFLTSGAARLIEEYGSNFLKETYVSKLYEGKWQGTMAMTEPDAGSSLSDITTMAKPIDDDEGVYSIIGQKIFISAGDHDAVSNIVHLLLARIEGAPEGTKGLSLFLVPKKRYTEDDDEIANDVNTVGVFRKMGYGAVPAVHLSFGEKKKCLGYLIGKPNEGLACMFQMMNEARIGVGLSAASLSSAAYYASLAYAKERPQGRKPDDKSSSSTTKVNIIEHADVRRMLFFQKAVAEGALSLLLHCAYYADKVKGGKEETKEIYQLILDLLTPVAKSFPSEMGILSTSAAIQVLGGAGYCKDFPLEQYYREMRIHTIHEGTTGIHGIDLLGRKIIMGGGIAFRAFTEEVSKTIKKVKFEVTELSKYGEKLNDALFRLQNITMKLSTVAMKEKKEVFLMDATLYLELFGIVAISWQWLLQAIPCQIALNESRGDTFYHSKLQTMRYFYEYELPKTEAIIARLSSTDRLLIEVDSKDFM